MKWPLEFSDQLIVGKEDSQISIITLWTKKEKVKEAITEDFAIIGQLYSPDEGVNALIRNLLANKNIRDIILIGADLSKSGEALKSFFDGNFDNIDKEIPKETLQNLKENITLHDYRTLKDYTLLNEIICNMENKSPYGSPEKFPKKEFAPPQTFPSEKAGFVIREDNIDNAWLKVLKLVMNFGTIKRSQYSEMQKELIALTIVIEKEDPNNPKLSHCFPFNKEDLESYYPQVLSNEKIDGVEYTYGQRLRDCKGIDQISKIIEKLKQAPYSRRAIAFTWQTETDYDNEKSPCLNMVHALVQNSELYLTAYFRSNDMYNAWPKNAFALRKLQNMIAKELELELGSLIIISDSAHIYKSSWKKAEAVLANFSVPFKNIGDPRGNLIIRVQDGEIKVIRETPEGKRLAEFSGKTSFEVYKKMFDENMVSEMHHAFYLGAELQKAEQAIKENKKYVQDS